MDNDTEKDRNYQSQSNILNQDIEAIAKMSILDRRMPKKKE
jgi:hypothetical protein